VDHVFAIPGLVVFAEYVKQANWQQ